MEKLTVTWADDSQKVVLCTYHEDGWVWADFYEALKRQNALIESSSAPIVDVIVDVRSSSWLPKGGSLLTGINKVKVDQHSRQGETIIVGARGMVAAIADVASKLMSKARRPMRFAKTMDEAHELIAQVAASRQTEKTAKN